METSISTVHYASIWPYKMGGLSWRGQFNSILLFQYICANYCLTPHNFSGISWREHVPFQDDDDVCFVLDQQTET